MFGSCNVLKRVDNRGRRLDTLNFDLRQDDSRTIVVQRLLDQILNFVRNLSATGGPGVFKLRLADNLTHRRFRGSFNRQFGIANLEEEFRRVLNFPENHKLGVDDILIAGQHQAFLRHVTRRTAARAG